MDLSTLEKMDFMILRLVDGVHHGGRTQDDLWVSHKPLQTHDRSGMRNDEPGNDSSWKR